MARSYKSKDARNYEEASKKMKAEPSIKREPIIEDQPQNSCCFQPGDMVSFRTNSRGVVLAVTGNGVQVDFGLGSGWFSQQSLTLIKADSVSK
jgi:hypothetical protein